MKTVDFFGTRISKMILGDNPVFGHSYIADRIPGKEMVDYYSPDNYLKLLRNAQSLGVNTYLGLANDYCFRIWRQFIRDGADMNLMFQTYPPMDLGANINQMMEYAPKGIYHQGGSLDYWLEMGEFKLVRERLKMIKDTGVPVGLGTHVPEVVIRAEEEDWGVDFYMTCLYNARKQQRGQQSGFITGKSKELVFYPGDKYEMFEVIKKVPKTCLVFKLLAGGQVFTGKDKAEYPAIIEREFRDAYANMKPNDVGVIGVFQRDHDQLAENVAIANKILEELD